MQQVYLEDGRLFGVTVFHCPPATVLQLKDEKTDGYRAVQLAFGQKKKAKAPILGHIKKSKSKIPARIKEARLNDEDELTLKVGDQVTIDQVLTDRDIVKATGISKGRGFAGVIKRHGFHSQPATHGASDRERAPGSIGAQTPGKVIKGKKMPGHMGNATVSIKNLKVLKVDAPANQILVIGSVPGPVNAWIEIQKTGKKANDTFVLATPPAPAKEPTKPTKPTRHSEPVYPERSRRVEESSEASPSTTKSKSSPKSKKS